MTDLLRDCLSRLGLHTTQLSGKSLTTLPFPVPSTHAFLVPGLSPQSQSVFVCYEDQGVVISVYRPKDWFSKVYEDYLQAKVLELSEYQSYRVSLWKGNKGVILRMHFTIEDDSWGTIELMDKMQAMEDAYSSVITRIRAGLPTLPLSRVIDMFLWDVGFRNIKQSVIPSGLASLVIAQLEDGNLDPAIRTFPIRFEVSEQWIAARVFFSENNAVATFGRHREGQVEELVALVNEMLVEAGYVFVKDRKQVHLVTRIWTRNMTSDGVITVLSDCYLSLLAHFKWTAPAFHSQIINPSLPPADSLTIIAHLNPAAPTDPPFFLTFPSMEAYLIYKATVAVLPASLCPRNVVSFDHANRRVSVARPLSLLSSKEVLRRNPSISKALFDLVLSVIDQTAAVGAFLDLDMVHISSSFLRITVIPLTEFRQTREESVMSLCRAIYEVAATPAALESESSLILSCEGLCVTEEPSPGVLHGRHHSQQVRLLQCPPGFLSDPALLPYVTEAGKLDYVTPVLGIAPIDDSFYCVHEYKPCSERLTLNAAISLGELLVRMHCDGLAHGFLSLATLTFPPVRVCLPCLRPQYFPLVSKVVTESLAAYVDPALHPYTQYSLAPDFPQLASADSYAYSCLLCQISPSLANLPLLQRCMTAEAAQRPAVSALAAAIKLL